MYIHRKSISDIDSLLSHPLLSFVSMQNYQHYQSCHHGCSCTFSPRIMVIHTQEVNVSLSFSLNAKHYVILYGAAGTKDSCSSSSVYLWALCHVDIQRHSFCTPWIYSYRFFTDLHSLFFDHFSEIYCDGFSITLKILNRVPKVMQLTSTLYSSGSLENSKSYLMQNMCSAGAINADCCTWLTFFYLGVKRCRT